MGSRFSPLQDADLVSLAQQGQVEAYGELYERYLDAIFRYIRSRVGLEPASLDLAEGVFLRAFESLENYQERGKPFSAYLYRIAQNAIIDYYRKQREETTLGILDHIGSSEPSLEDRVAQNEQVRVLQRALAELPADYQEVIRLRVMLDLPTVEVAAWMDRSEGAVRVLLFRALKALRRLVKAPE